MLSIENLTFSYSRRKPPVLDNFNLKLNRGNVYGLLGPNGAGKSTLLYLIAGALTPASGKVLFDGTDTRLRKPSTLCDIFMVPEEFTLPHISFTEYVRRNAPFYPRFSESDLRRHTETFGIEREVNLGTLSMGQKKKALMCFALAANTSLLLMDEPTNGLDIPGKATFRRFIASAMTDERSVVISTHQVRDVDRLLDHIIIMDRHNVILNKSVKEITDALQFTVSQADIAPENALLTQRGLEGTHIIAPNTTGTDTEIDLETLFELALTNPTSLNNQFIKKES